MFCGPPENLPGDVRAGSGVKLPRLHRLRSAYGSLTGTFCIQRGAGRTLEKGVIVIGYFVDPDNGAFQKMRADRFFVDKTDFLEYTNSLVDTEDAFLCVSRPRGFGKTAAAEMICSYYSCGCDSEELFRGLKISSNADYRTHMNRYHVIRLNLLDLSDSLNAERLFQKTHPRRRKRDYSGMNLVYYITQKVFSELKAVFPGRSSWQAGLSEILADIHQNDPEHPQFIVVIDEWDLLFQREDPATKQEDYIGFLSDLFLGTTTREYIAFAYLTGVFPIQKRGIQARLTVFDEDTAVTSFLRQEPMGFTEEEVKKLCLEANMPFGEIQKWYEGYSFVRGGPVYNPYSVIRALQSGTCAAFWPNTESCGELSACMNRDPEGLQQAMALLLEGQEVSADTEIFSEGTGEAESRDEVLTQMVHMGYLTCRHPSGTESRLKIPSLEIRRAFGVLAKHGD